MPPYMNRLAYPLTARMGLQMREAFLRKLLTDDFMMGTVLDTSVSGGVTFTAHYPGIASR